MTTISNYRQYAQECIESARSATNDTVRHQFLELATLWMTAADRLDRAARGPDISKFDGHTPPNTASMD